MGRITRVLDELATAAGAIAGGDLNVRIAPQSDRDKLGTAAEKERISGAQQGTNLPLRYSRKGGLKFGFARRANSSDAAPMSDPGSPTWPSLISVWARMPPEKAAASATAMARCSFLMSGSSSF